MEIGKILVPVIGTDAGLVTLDTALEVGRHFSAHVEGLHARRNTRDAPRCVGRRRGGSAKGGRGARRRPLIHINDFWPWRT